MASPYAPWGTSISVPCFDHVKDMSVAWGAEEAVSTSRNVLRNALRLAA